MPNLSGLKTEIASVNDIGKITGAMELVATAKLKRVGKRATEIKQYVSEVYEVFNEIISQTDNSIYLKKSADGFKKTLWVVVNSNLGLCGGYNSNMNKMIKPMIKKDDEVLAIGNKAVSFYTNNKFKIKDKVLDVDVNFDSNQAREIATRLLECYNSGEFDEIQLAYTKFINNVTFEPTTLRIFPIVKEKKDSTTDAAPTASLDFEPDAETVLKSSVSLYVNTIIYGTFIESQLSEQASRRTAMEAATKNGKELKDNLSILYNRKRQDAITQEISEIVSGANAQSDN